MAETTTQERPNSVTITDAGPSRKKLAIEIPAETVDEKLGETLDTLAVEAQLPGFRKGHAPRKLLEKKFGPDLRDQAKSDLIAAAYQRAVEEHELRVVGEPQGEHLADLEVVDGQPLSFEVEVEVMPQFELPSLEGIEVKKPTVDITEEMVEKEIEKICINEGTLEERETPEPGDYLTGHAVMTGKDGTEHYNLNGAVVQCPTSDKEGKGMILGVMVDDFEKQLGLPKPGDSVTIKLKGPENHEIEAIRGDDLTIAFTVERVDRIIPSKPEDLVANFGMESTDQLREIVRARLTQRAYVQQQSVMRQQVARHLVENTEIELPEQLTTSQAGRNLERRRMELMYRGVSADEIEQHMAELRASASTVAVRELKLFFILNRIADDEDIRVDESEVNGRISQIAAERGERPEKLRQELVQSNRVGSIFQQIREHKVMDMLLAKANVAEMPADQFNEEMRKLNAPSGE